jgi:hypothetical protein
MEDRPIINLPSARYTRPGSKAQPRMAARFGGRLAGGTVEGGHYCVWLTDRGDTTALLWPPGYRARLHPLEILDPDGNLVARTGDLLEVGGGHVPVDPTQPCMMGRSSAFAVQSIIG